MQRRIKDSQSSSTRIRAIVQLPLTAISIEGNHFESSERVWQNKWAKRDDWRVENEIWNLAWRANGIE